VTDYYEDAEPYTPPKPYGPKFTAHDVKNFRNINECSFAAAKEELMNQQILADLAKGKCGHDVSLLYDILEYMVRERLTPNW